MRKPLSIFSTNQLLCEENAVNWKDEDRGMESSGSITVEDGFDNEYVETLLDAETRCGEMRVQEFLLSSWIIRARLDAIQYILRTRERFGFGVQTAYSSVTYFDRFLSRRSVGSEKSWAVRLLSMACLSLAAKMEESAVPALSGFCSEDYSFESSVIQRMELVVLNTLEWKMGSVSPFAFIQFYANRFCDPSLPRNGVTRIVEAILSGMRDVKIMSHRPSVMAAAATLAVLEQGLTRDALQGKISPLTSTGRLQTEDVISCYYDFLEMDVKSPSPIQSNSSVTSMASAKRKRVEFSEDDDVPDRKG